MCLVWLAMSSSISLPSLTRGRKQAPYGQDLGLYSVVHILPPRRRSPSSSVLPSNHCASSSSRKLRVCLCSISHILRLENYGPWSDHRHPNHWCWVLESWPGHLSEEDINAESLPSDLRRFGNTRMSWYARRTVENLLGPFLGFYITFGVLIYWLHTKNTWERSRIIHNVNKVSPHHNVVPRFFMWIFP